MIGERIKQLRLSKGYNMRQMATALNMPYTTYVNYEKDAREPNSEQLLLISKYFDVSIDYLIGRIDNIDFAHPILPITPTQSVPEDSLTEREHALGNLQVLPNNNLNEREKTLVDKYRQLTPDDQNRVDERIDTMIESYPENQESVS